MADENVVLGIELGGTGKLLDTIGDLTKHIEDIAKTIKGLPSFQEAITGRDPNAVKKLNQDVAGLTKDVDQLLKVVKEKGNEGIFSQQEVKGLTGALAEYTTALTQISSQLSQFFSNVSPNMDAMYQGWQAISDEVKYNREILEGLKNAQIQATSSEEWEALQGNISQTTRKIEEAEDALTEMEQAGEGMEAYGIALTDETDIKVLEDLVYGLPRQLQEAQNEVASIKDEFGGVIGSLTRTSAETRLMNDLLAEQDQYIKELNKEEQHRQQIVNDYSKTVMADLETMISQRDRLRDLEAATFDPKIKDVAIKKQAKLNKEIEKQKKLLLDTSSVDSFTNAITGMETPIRNIKTVLFELAAATDERRIKSILGADTSGVDRKIARLEAERDAAREFRDEQKKANEEAFMYEAKLQDEIGDRQAQLQQLVLLQRKTHDPQQLQLILDKEKQITAEIKDRQKALKASQDVRATRMNTLMSSPTGSGGDISNALGQVSALSNTLSDISPQIVGFAEKLGIAGESFEVNGVKLEDFFSSLGSIFEQQQGTFQGIMDLQKQVVGLGDNLQSWSAGIKQSNKALQAGGKQLNMFQRSLGKIGGMGGKLGGMLGGLGKAIGFAGAAIQGASIGFQVYDTLMGRNSEQIEKRIQNFKREQKQMRELNDLYEQGSQEARLASIEQKREEVRQARAHMNFVRENAVQMTSTFDQLRTIGGHLLGDNHVYGRAADEIRDASTEVDRLEQELSELTSAAAIAAVEFAKFEKDMERMGQAAIESVSRYQDELFSARVEIIAAEEKVIEDLNNLQEEYNEETRNIMEKREDQDRKALKDHLNELATMEQDYEKKLEELRVDHYKELAKIEENYLQDLADELREYEENRAETIAEFREAEQEAMLEYQEEQAEARENYDKKIAKMEEDFNKERIKRQKDLESQLFEAEIENDALRYFMLQRQGEEEEAEAQAQHQEAMTEAEKEFAEEQKERAEQFAEKQRERAEEHREELANMKEEHTERIAERKRQFDEEVQQQKDAHQERLEQEEYFYAEQRAQAVQAFRDRQEDLKKERAEEDNARLERLAARRQELEDTFQAELAYFERREQVLTDFINRIGGLEGRRAGLVDFVQSGGGTASIDDAQFLIDRLNEQAQTIRNFAPGGDVSQLTREQQAELIAIENTAARLQYNMEQAAASGQQLIEIDLLEGVDQNALAEFGFDFTTELVNAINTTMYGQMASVENAMQIDLKYIDEDMHRIALMVNDLTANGQMLFEDLSAQHQEMLTQMGLNQTDWNMMTVDEQKEFLENQQEILRQQGEESTEELSNTTQEIGDNAIETFDTIESDTREANQNLIEENEQHWADRESDENAFQNDIIDAQEIANQDRLDEDQAYQDAATALEGDTTDARITEQEDGQQAMVDSEGEFNDEMATLRDEANETAVTQNDELNENIAEQNETANQEELTREEEQLLMLEELSIKFFEAEMERMNEQFVQKEELALQMHEMEIERLILQFERENEMWMMFMENLAKLFEDTSRQIFSEMARTVQTYGNRIVMSYNQINQAIVQSAAQAYQTLMNYVAQANAAAQSGGGWGGSSPGSGSGSRRGGLFAAKGAFIDEPTMLIAGEGDSPELVMPFDESKGIPDDVARAFMSAVTGGSGLAGGDELAPERVGGAMNDQLLGAILTQLTRMEMGMQLTIESVEVGSNISRQEIREQFGAMQKAVVDVLHTSVNMN